MNCRQLDELLPLYAGRDLDEKRARLVSEHIQICSACAQVAGEYRDAVELAQHFAPPVFSDTVYASVRRQVMQQIEDEPTTPLLPQMFAGWFRPRIAWAAASALIIAFGFFTFYFVVNRGDGKGSAGRQVVSTPETIRPFDPAAQPPDISAPAVGGEERQPLTGNRPTRRKTFQKAIVKRTNNIVTVSRDVASAGVSPDTDSVPVPARFPPGSTATSEHPLRLEIQTTDPNIRIIWFTQQDTKPAVPASKGT